MSDKSTRNGLVSRGEAFDFERRLTAVEKADEAAECASDAARSR